MRKRLDYETEKQVSAAVDRWTRGADEWADGGIEMVQDIVDTVLASLTIDDAMVERAAMAAYDAWDGEGWEELTDSWQADWRDVARAVIAVLRPRP